MPPAIAANHELRSNGINTIDMFTYRVQMLLKIKQKTWPQETLAMLHVEDMSAIKIGLQAIE